MFNKRFVKIILILTCLVLYTAIGFQCLTGSSILTIEGFSLYGLTGLVFLLFVWMNSKLQEDRYHLNWLRIGITIFGLILGISILRWYKYNIFIDVGGRFIIQHRMLLYELIFYIYAILSVLIGYGFPIILYFVLSSSHPDKSGC